MAGFASYDDVILEITTNGKFKSIPFLKTSSAPEAAGVMHSLWRANGMPGAAGADTSTPGAALTSDPASIFLQDEASDYKFLIGVEAVANVNCNLIIYDRLVAVGGVLISSTGTKTVNSAALPRYSGAAAVGVEAWAEVSVITAAAAVIDMNSYTDQAGNTTHDGPNTPAFPAAATNVDTIVPFPLASGDYGVQAIATIGVGTSGAGSAAISVLLVKRLATIPLVANQGVMVDFVRALPGPIRLYDGASLAMAIVASGTGAVTVQGSMKFAWG